jgi:hypothetical protein
MYIYILDTFNYYINIHSASSVNSYMNFFFSNKYILAQLRWFSITAISLN